MDVRKFNKLDLAKRAGIYVITPNEIPRSAFKVGSTNTAFVRRMNQGYSTAYPLGMKIHYVSTMGSTDSRINSTWSGRIASSEKAIQRELTNKVQPNSTEWVNDSKADIKRALTRHHRPSEGRLYQCGPQSCEEVNFRKAGQKSLQKNTSMYKPRETQKQTNDRKDRASRSSSKMGIEFK